MISVVALFCLLMMVAMMWMMIGGMSAFHGGPKTRATHKSASASRRAPSQRE